MSLAWLIAGRCAAPLACAQSAAVDADVVAAVQSDWAAQERRAGRELGSVASIQAALGRGLQLLESLVPIAGAAAS